MERFLAACLQQGVGCRRPVYRPLHHHLSVPVLPHSEEAWQRNVSLPIYPSLEESQVERVIQVVKKAIEGSPWTGPGFKGWVAEDPFEANLDPNAPGKEIHAHAYTRDEEPAYWDHGVDRKDTPLKGDYPLIVHTPKYGRKVFTGNTHMPTPTKVMFYTNVNIINNAKWAYGVIKNVDPLVGMIISTDIEMTASIEYSDIALAASAWPEFQTLEVTSSCSNPFLALHRLLEVRPGGAARSLQAPTLGQIGGRNVSSQ